MEHVKTPPALAGARILVVDDEAFQLALLDRLLKSAGYIDVTTSSTPEGVAELHRAQDFDLILLDVHMPGMNGLEVLEQLRQAGGDDPVPVIVLTGDTDVATQMLALSRGARDFLSKPPRREELLSRIHNTLEARFLARQNRMQKERYQKLLHNILPRHIVARLDRGEEEIVDYYGDVAVLFVDLVGFSSTCARIEPAIVVDNLNRIFLAIDELALSHGIEKIKTIGDAYLAVSGLYDSDAGHFHRMADFALAVIRRMEEMAPELAIPSNVRVGIERGDLITGMLKGHRSAFDIWGDTVNAAARLQSAAEPGRIIVSDYLARALGGAFDLLPNGSLSLRGVGKTETFFLASRSEKRASGTEA